MIRRFVRAVVQNATVTDAEAVALRIDPIILRAADVLPFEEVEIVSMATGERFTTFAQPAVDGSGVVAVPRMRRGDKVTIVSYGLLHDGQTLGHRAKNVVLSDANEVVSLTES